MSWNGKQYNGVPGGAQLWRHGNSWFLVYQVPNSSAKLGYKITSGSDLQALWNGQGSPRADRTFSNRDQMLRAGMIYTNESHTQLNNTSEHPFQLLLQQFQREAQIRPWLRDPEVMALQSRAILEGREMTEAELKSTNWWRSRNEQERNWAVLQSSDPRSANYLLQNNRNAVRQMLSDAGLGNYGEDLVKLIADRMTVGTWSASAAERQIKRLADPHAPGKLHPDLVKFLRDPKLVRNQEHEARVRELALQWLGPRNGMRETDIARWAGEIRNRPGAEDRLIEHLQKQRLALFPEYTDPSLTYDDIAAPWRGFVQDIWGQTAQERDLIFHELIRNNDANKNRELLMEEGLRRGNENVNGMLLRSIGQAFGQSVSREAV